jgi:hypothetical protein
MKSPPPLWTRAGRPSVRVGDPEQRLVDAPSVIVSYRRACTADQWLQSPSIMAIEVISAALDDDAARPLGDPIADGRPQAVCSRVLFPRMGCDPADVDRDVERQPTHHRQRVPATRRAFLRHMP